MTRAKPLLPLTPVLDTARLTLRPLRSDDAPVLQRRFPRWEIVRHLAAHMPWPYPNDGAARFIARCLEEMSRGLKHHWAIEAKAGPRELIGAIDLWPDDGVSRDMRGFWLDPEFQGQGFMTEAAERVTECAFLELGWPCLWLRNAEANGPSGRIKEKQGARLIDRAPARFVSGEGTAMVWRLDRDDWRTRRENTPDRL